MTITTCPVRILYPEVFEWVEYEGNLSKSVRMLFNKKEKKQMDSLKAIKAEYDAFMESEYPDSAKRPRIPFTGHAKSPVQDVDKDTNSTGVPLLEKYPEAAAGHFMMKVSKWKNSKAGDLIVVDQGNQKIMDSSKIYSGCWCEVNINAYKRMKQENPGISFGLNGVRFARDDEQIGGTPSADAMFGQGSEIDEGFGQEDPFGNEGDPLL